MKYSMLAAGAFLLVGSALAVGIASQDDSKLAAGLYIGDLAIGGLSASEAKARAQAQYGQPHEITVQMGEKSWKISASKLGWSYNADKSIDAAATFTNERKPLERLEASLQELTGRVPKRVYTPVYQVDQQKAKEVLSALAKEVATEPKNAQVGFDRKTKRYAVVKADVVGKKADVATALKSYLADPNMQVLNVPIITWEAKVTAQKLQANVDQGNAMMRPLTITLAGSPKSMTLTALQVANFYWVREHGIEMDDKAIQRTFKSITQHIDRPAQSARYAWKQGAFSVVPERTGYVTDQKPAYELFYKSISDIDKKAVEFPATVSQPAVVAASLPDPEQLELIATGSSHYYGSSAERRFNVANAAKKIDGTVVGKGEVFSFLQAVGGITRDNGFGGGLIISGGRTVDGLGGGVCQVSTTAFRALYNAGLPVVERHQHSYRVKYYEPQVGFEAAVYDPGLDLRMKNDTSAPILIRAVNNDAHSYLEVQVWGIKPKRTVNVSQAVILSSTPHPPAKTVVNPRLRRGVVRQVDWAQNGYVLYITRTIKDESGVRTDRIDTNYRPWQAVYERGPS